MTVSTSTGRTFTIDKIIRLAYNRAGLLVIGQPATDAELAHGRDVLEEVTDELEVHGTLARVTEFVTLPITQDVTTYAMPATAVDLLSPAMYIDSTNTDTDRADGETPIQLVREEEWTQYASKSARGRPTQMYADRTEDIIKAVLWPVPSEVGASVRFFVHRRLADTDDGNATLDLQNYWNAYIITRLASLLAQESSLDARAAGLAAQAEQKLKLARGKANERPGTQMYVDHDTGHGTGGWRA